MNECPARFHPRSMRRLRARLLTLTCALLALWAMPVVAQTAPPPRSVTYLSDLAWVSATNGWGPVERDRSNGEKLAGDGRPLTLRGTTYAKGLGVHAASDISYDLNGQYTTFLADVGVDDATGGLGSVVFQVWVNGVKNYDSGLVTGTSPVKSVRVDVTGRTTLRLVVTNGGNNINSDHADWADARLLATSATPNPVPTLTSLAPTRASARGAAFTLTVNGTGFMIGAGVRWNGANRTTTFKSATQLIAAIPASDIARPGTAKVTVVNPAPGGHISKARVLTIATVPNHWSPGTTFLSDLTWVSATNGWGPVERDRSSGEKLAGDGGPIRIRGNIYAKGLGVHAASDITYNLRDKYTTFVADVGIDDATGGLGSVVFQVWVNGVKNYDSGLVTGTSPVKSVRVDVTGRATLRLVVTNGGDNINSDHANWANARLLATPGPNPVTAAASRAPTGASAGGDALRLTVNGTSFMTGATVGWNDGSRMTTTTSASQLTAASPASDITTPGTAQMTVVTPEPGGGTSDALTTITGTASSPPPLPGLLRVHPRNPRYFTDGSGQAIYLTGSHTWNTIQDHTDVALPGGTFAGLLDWLAARGHNFLRLWMVEHAVGEGVFTRTSTVSPLPWLRTGPGTALDGQPKFDLTQFNPVYFDRLRQRAIAAGSRGFYVSVMLFDDWSTENPHAWQGHPFHPSNNVNGADGDPNDDGLGLEFHTLQVSTIVALQDEYVKKVVDTVNDLDHVIYEVANETDTTGALVWQTRVVDLIRQYEASKPKQHLVGMTVGWPVVEVDNTALFNSTAEWMSPNATDTAGFDYRTNPRPNDGRKVILSDTDHLWGVGGDRLWVWKSFLRGLHPIFMDPLDDDATRESARRAMGDTLVYAKKINLVTMAPSPDLTSTGYSLANPGVEYLVYQPDSGAFTVTLAAGTYSVEWFNPSTGEIVPTSAPFTVPSTSSLSFTPPFTGDAVLYLRLTGAPPPLASSAGSSASAPSAGHRRS